MSLRLIAALIALTAAPALAQDSGFAVRKTELERVMAARLDRFAGQPQLAERFSRTFGGR